MPHKVSLSLSLFNLKANCYHGQPLLQIVSVSFRPSGNQTLCNGPFIFFLSEQPYWLEFKFGSSYVLLVFFFFFLVENLELVSWHRWVEDLELFIFYFGWEVEDLEVEIALKLERWKWHYNNTLLQDL